MNFAKDMKIAGSRARPLKGRAPTAKRIYKKTQIGPKTTKGI